MIPVAPRLVFPLLLSATALAQWPSDVSQNLGVCTATGDQAVPKIAVASDGGTWIAWFDNRGGSYAVYAQKLDVAGYPRFPANGLLVSAEPQSSSLVDWDIASDGAGGCVLAFTDTRNGGDLDVHAYRLSASGAFLWGATGVPLSNNADYEANPKIARLSDGSFAVTWSRLPSPGPGAVHVQKLDASGVPQYAGDGIEIVGPGTEKPGFSAIAASDAGGYVVGYVRDISTFASPRHYRAQKFDAAGTPLWNGGTPLAIYDAASMPIAYQPIVRADGAGGAVFAWHSAVGSTFDCWIQRVTAAGAEVHAHNGVQVSTEASRSKLDPSIGLAANGDVVVAFNKRDLAQSQWATCAQRISPAGARLWTNDGIELLPFNGVPKQFERCTVASGSNLAHVVTFEQTNYPSQGLRALAFLLDSNGSSGWGPSPVVVSSVLSPKDKPGLVVGPYNDARLAWDDARNDSGDVHAQALTALGEPGPPVGQLGAGFCFGDGSGTTCPCGNTGSFGHGCANSVNAAGARLTGVGVTSLASDSVVLHAAGMPNSSVLFFQGTSQQSGGAGTQFGDGKRCAGGTVVRLGTKSNVAGVSSYPEWGDQPVSVRGLVVAPGTRAYQAWYRNAASYCTISTFNLSNGLEIFWGP
ncbi:MAG: hypothetical protein JNK02_10045 [Planctomycetes bacterium]|nr:hypothetical protein [Planctomycetota bacterium]